MDASNEARHSAAHYFLEGLNEIGFDYLFCNFGTDHAPLIEAMAAFKRADRTMPAVLLCPHENSAVAAGAADTKSIDAIAGRLLAAERPLLISSYAGRNHATVALIDELARFAGIRVIEFNPLYLNLPHDSPCHGGFMPAKALAEADVGLLVDVDVPWIPSDLPDHP